jgi:uncharacterized protein (TIGR04255 family)
VRFERAKRLKYKKNPLADVSCEIRFPPLLKLVQHGPVELQPILQPQYPLLEIHELASVRIAVGAPQAVESSSQPQPRRYVFKMQEGTWSLAISADSLVLTTNKYTRWEEFRTRLTEALKAFLPVYRPSRYLRVGLRYIDAVDPMELGLPENSVSKWLNPALHGLLAEKLVKESDVLDSSTYALLKLEPRGKLGLRWGLGGRQTDNGPRRIYVLDGDFFDDSGLDVNADLYGLLDDFNVQAGGLFQWAFSDVLRAALEPEELG